MALQYSAKFMASWTKTFVRFLFLGDLGSGIGKNGGTGGSIRDAGGAFGKLEAAREEEYFNKKQKEDITLLKKQLEKGMKHHEEQRKNHEDVLVSHKKRLAELNEHEMKWSE